MKEDSKLEPCTRSAALSLGNASESHNQASPLEGCSVGFYPCDRQPFSKNTKKPFNATEPKAKSPANRSF